VDLRRSRSWPGYDAKGCFPSKALISIWHRDCAGKSLHLKGPTREIRKFYADSAAPAN